MHIFIMCHDLLCAACLLRGPAELRVASPAEASALIGALSDAALDKVKAFIDVNTLAAPPPAAHAASMPMFPPFDCGMIRILNVVTMIFSPSHLFLNSRPARLCRPLYPRAAGRFVSRVRRVRYGTEEIAAARVQGR